MTNIPKCMISIVPFSPNGLLERVILRETYDEIRAKALESEFGQMT